ncbi:dihydrofolate reductase [Candidatus Saccharibacteria bacterium TM7i]|nr:dihydrofolate reductase [Candidatus Saccharibacteria bacterium TM7i]
MNRLVVAYDRNRAVGRNGDIPWMGALPADMQHFRELTWGESVIMGRKTFESLPEASRPLRDRENIVVSLSQKAIEGALVAHSLEEALEQAQYEPFIIGGGQLYKEALPYVDRIDATEIDTTINDADTYFPMINLDEWEIVQREAHSADARNKFNYAFTTYLRRGTK